jgi:REP element-mobilizing transposase RayT
MKRTKTLRKVIAHHIIFTCYGFWLPNDPRGSWSDFVGSWELAQFGRATKTNERRSLAREKHDHDRRDLAKSALKYEPVILSGIQARAVARGIARAVEESGYRVIACSIMPDHVHAVVQRHDNPAERIIAHFKARATQQLLIEGLHPFQPIANDRSEVPMCWVKRGWKVFLYTQEDVRRATDYVNRNPLLFGMRAQRWGFVEPFWSERARQAGRLTAGKL